MSERNPIVLKVRYIVLTFLMCNRGKKFTAKEIWSFIIENNLLPSTSTMPYPHALAGMVRRDKGKARGVLARVEMEGQHPILYYIP